MKENILVVSIEPYERIHADSLDYYAKERYQLITERMQDQ